jgi:peptidoglycan-associated lipoprotein
MFVSQHGRQLESKQLSGVFLMKLTKLNVALLSLIWFSGCSTLGGNGNSALENEDGVVVEERGANASGIDGNNASGTAMGDGTEANIIAGGSNFEGNALDDPASPLSNRVVYFEYDSSAVRQEDQITLEAHGIYLAENPKASVRLEGHTDERGSREYNLALGERRALAIRQILMLQGASVNQFQVTSFGEERPQSEGDGEANWQNNRRVEIVYLGR